MTKNLSPATDGVDAERLAKVVHLAATSPDDQTQCAAQLYNSTYTWPIGTAVNEIPVMSNRPERWQYPAKNHYVCHAEVGAIADAASRGFKTEGTTLYATWLICADCAKLVLASGVSRVVGLVWPDDDVQARWRDSIEAGLNILREGGVSVEFLSIPPVGVLLRRGGREVLR